LRVAHAAIRAAHRLAGVRLDVEDARLVLVMKGIVRSRAGRRSRRAAPAVPAVLRRLLAALPSPVTPEAAAPAMAARHRAMLLIGFGAALRRSEIVALRVGDVTEVEGRGLSVLVRRGKTDQQGRGKSIAIWANHREPDFCPVAAFEGWMRFRGRGAADERPLFCAISSAGALSEAAMSDKIVARLMKQACELAGLDASRFSGHSLRRGLLTAAGDLQLPLFDVMRQSRHVSVETAMTYMESGDSWRNNITERVFGAD
jgi:integrase